MRSLVSRLAVLTAAIALLPASTALAAPPEKQATLTSTSPSYNWSGTGSGFVLTSAVGNRIGCNPGLFYCDFVLVKTEELGSLVFTTGSTDKSLVDVDLHVYESDADGTQGDLWGESTGGSPAEAVALTDAPAGYWLVKVDYYAGAGTYQGTAQFTPAS
jgi:hypothetical protein